METEIIAEGIRRYRKMHNESLLGTRVAHDMMLENEAGKQCALFQIRVRCASAYRRDKIYH